MKVTTILPDELVENVKTATGGKNITESLIIALSQYLESKNLYKLLDEIEEKPLQFSEDFSAYGIRKINRQR